MKSLQNTAKLELNPLFFCLWFEQEIQWPCRLPIFSLEKLGMQQSDFQWLAQCYEQQVPAGLTLGCACFSQPNKVFCFRQTASVQVSKCPSLPRIHRKKATRLRSGWVLAETRLVFSLSDLHSPKRSAWNFEILPCQVGTLPTYVSGRWSLSFWVWRAQQGKKSEVSKCETRLIEDEGSLVTAENIGGSGNLEAFLYNMYISVFLLK